MSRSRGTKEITLPRAADDSLPEPSRGPDLAVVIPARNEAPRIEASLRSVRVALEEAGTDAYEVVVVDDDSSDGTAEVARTLGARVVLQRPRQGPLAGWRLGVRSTSAPLIVFVDADCVVLRQAFDAFLRRFDDGTVGCVGGRAVPRQCESPRGLLCYSGCFSAAVRHQMNSRIENHDCIAMGGLMAVRRDAWRVQDADEYPNDRVVAARAKEAGWRIVYEPGAEVVYEAPTRYRQLRAQYRRNGAAPVASVSFDRLPAAVVVRALGVSALSSPRHAIGWGLVRVPLLAERLLGRMKPTQSFTIQWDGLWDEPARSQKGVTLSCEPHLKRVDEVAEAGSSAAGVDSGRDDR